MLRAKSAILVYCDGRARETVGAGGAGDWTGVKEVGVVRKGEADGDLYGLGVTVVR